MKGTPTTQVSAALSHQTQRQERADAMDLGKVDADQLIKQSTYVEVEHIGLPSPRCQDSCRLIGFVKKQDRGRKELCNAALFT